MKEKKLNKFEKRICNKKSTPVVVCLNSCQKVMGQCLSTRMK